MVIRIQQSATLGTELSSIDEIKVFSAEMSQYLPHYLGIDAQLPTRKVILIFEFPDDVDSGEIEEGVALAEAYGT